MVSQDEQYPLVSHRGNSTIRINISVLCWSATWGCFLSLVFWQRQQLSRECRVDLFLSWKEKKGLRYCPLVVVKTILLNLGLRFLVSLLLLFLTEFGCMGLSSGFCMHIVYTTGNVSSTLHRCNYMVFFV